MQPNTNLPAQPVSTEQAFRDKAAWWANQWSPHPEEHEAFVEGMVTCCSGGGD